MWAFTLLAEGGRAGNDPFSRPEVIWGTAALAGAFFAGAFVIYLADRWRKRLAANSHAAAELTDFRGMYERGEITEEEYARLRNRVAERVKTPPPAARPAPPTTPPAGQPNEQQPNGQSPNGQSPSGQQPGGQSPGGQSPNGQPPAGQAPAEPPPPA